MVKDYTEVFGDEWKNFQLIFFFILLFECIKKKNFKSLKLKNILKYFFQILYNCVKSSSWF